MVLAPLTLSFCLLIPIRPPKLPNPRPPPPRSRPPPPCPTLRSLLLNGCRPPGARPPGPLIYCCWADGVEWNGGPAGVGSRQDEGAALRCVGSGDILAVLLCIRSPRYYPTALSFLQGDALISRRLPLRPHECVLGTC